jgi:hypothetical protein
MKIIKRRSFTLLETLIAISLTVIILGALTYFYSQVVSLQRKSDRLQVESFKNRYLEYRLLKVIPQTVNPDNENYFFTYTELGGGFKPGSSRALVFTFDNGIKIEKEFSNKVLGLLYLDQDGKLSLATWPSPDRWEDGIVPPMKNEILRENVLGFKMQFFVPPDKKWEGEKLPSKQLEVNPSPAGAWIDEWSDDYKQLPGMIRLEVKLRTGVEYYVFPFPNTARQIIFNQ